jgi:hypothetical protein
MMSPVTFPEMRLEVIDALRSLSDPEHQRTKWGRYDELTNYYDDLTLNVHTLYDDCQVLPTPEAAVPDVIQEEEVPAFRQLGAVLGPLISELGELPDDAYRHDARWPKIIEAAAHALAVMRRTDEGQE